MQAVLSAALRAEVPRVLARAAVCAPCLARGLASGGRGPRASRKRQRDSVPFVFPAFGAVAAPPPDLEASRAVDLLLKDGCRLLGSYDGNQGEDSGPQVRHEVAFLGRSNVGKSSLVNALLRQPGLAPTSRAPGRTRRIFFYGMGKADHPSAVFVDMPGYGFAKHARGLQDEWLSQARSFLESRPRTVLRRVVLLVDARLALPQGVAAAVAGQATGSAADRTAVAAALTAELAAPQAAPGIASFAPTSRRAAAAAPEPPLVSMSPDDVEAAELLEALGMPWMIVFTKSDTVSPAERAAIAAAIDRTVGHRPKGPLPAVTFASAATGDGVAELRHLLAGRSALAPLPSRSRRAAMQSRRRQLRRAQAEQQGAQQQMESIDYRGELPAELPAGLLGAELESASPEARLEALRDAVAAAKRG